MEEIEADTISLVRTFTDDAASSSINQPGLSLGGPVPKTSVGTSREYQEKMVQIVAKGYATIPPAVYMSQEEHKTQTITAETFKHMLRARIARKIETGAFIIEAANFAAVACWEKPETTMLEAQQPLPDALIMSDLRKRRPHFAEYLWNEEVLKRECMPDAATKGYWHLSMMARDLDRQSPGAVRALIEPFVKIARENNQYAWLDCGTEHARDVYVHLGFEVVGEWCLAKGSRDARGNETPDGSGRGIPTWCLMVR